MLLLASHGRGVGWYNVVCARSLQRTSHRTSSAVPSATRANTALSCSLRFPADRLTASVNFFLISLPGRPQSWLSGKEGEVCPATATPTPGPCNPHKSYSLPGPGSEHRSGELKTEQKAREKGFPSPHMTPTFLLPLFCTQRVLPPHQAPGTGSLGLETGGSQLLWGSGRDRHLNLQVETS